MIGSISAEPDVIVLGVVLLSVRAWDQVNRVALDASPRGAHVIDAVLAVPGACDVHLAGQARPEQGAKVGTARAAEA